ncbi:hypothetical protein CF081_19720 [Clostridium botulinum]|uniref:hypothetical protein n=1 Tax=Clostridium botulinum TaxID=1491 RepID=UPI000772E898|nr:hypothetical protein [Clostridium botulinum]AUN08955.1 hypothetical protein RSJ14_20040 [Clostridium botulinum]MBN3352647.1 hypothetical protein [Clostridium botulinum]MBN3368381.1 hypothetical protein [Clostridium botulinum]MBN3375863.1 hypothetical protein [Clostridium botulinum]
MNKKGIVSYANNINKIARITFPDLNDNVTYELKIASHVGELLPGKIVLVSFWSNNMVDGIVIAELR